MVLIYTAVDPKLHNVHNMIQGDGAAACQHMIQGAAANCCLHLIQGAASN